ncbi:MAG: hypothetical protein Q7T66_10390 [Herminiimonas sp.]|nr:hypothetical protein [Herminiimonas sp.]MDO9421061.1 hypothetical protein [Herminiimonas sp.]
MNTTSAEGTTTKKAKRHVKPVKNKVVHCVTEDEADERTHSDCLQH